MGVLTSNYTLFYLDEEKEVTVEIDSLKKSGNFKL